MNVVVCVKQVGKLEDEIEFVDDDTAVDPDFLEYDLNEWDGYAVEAALQLRDAHGGAVLVVTVGDEESEAALRRCLAMGADRAMRVWSQALGNADPITVARALAGVAGDADLVLCGVQSSDAVQGATGGALAGLLRRPVVPVVSALEVQGAAALVTRELEGGLREVLEVDLPAVLTIQTGINEPRYVTLRSIQEARTQPIEEIDPGDLGPPAARVRELTVPERRKADLIGGGPAEIAGRLREIVRETVGA